MKRPIAISLSPNTELDDILLSISVLLRPWIWFSKGSVKVLENEFAAIFGDEYKAIAVNSGRSALYLILNAIGAGKGDEVCLQAFTCVAVPNSVIWNGAKPVYIDIGSNYNMDYKDLKEKLGENTRAIIVQHTFGIPTDMENIIKIAKIKNIKIIEDCAHSLGGVYNKKKLGTFGDISFFSFGRDKVLSSVFGGIILCKDKKLYVKLSDMVNEMDNPTPFWVVQQILHPILFYIILPLYFLGFGKVTLGKLLLVFLQKIKMLSLPIYDEEKKGIKPDVFPKKMPGGLAILATHQLQKLEKFNKIRREIAELYFKSLKESDFSLPMKIPGAVWLRFPLRHKNASEIVDFSRKMRVLLGNWYKGVVQPMRQLTTIGYELGSCPKAEKISTEILNLPTYPTMNNKDARKIIEILNSWEAIK